MSTATISTLSISGITCSGCVNTLTRVLKEVPGVEDVAIDQETGHTQIRHLADQAPLAQLQSAIEDAGYDVD